MYNFAIVDPEFKVKLFNLYARPRLEYCSQIWNPSFVGDILAVEAVQRNFTGKLLGRNISYRSRLLQLGMELLAVRRLKLDLVFCYNVILGNTILNASDYFTFNVSVTRGHRYKLHVIRFNSLLKKHVFSRRIVHVWNSLPDFLFEMGTMLSFKSRLNVWYQENRCLDSFIGLNEEQLDNLLDSRGFDI